MIFRQLSDTEAQQFRQWARDNYKPFSEIKGIYHPVIQSECVKMNQESSTQVADKFPIE